MEKCFMIEKKYLIKFYLKKGVKHCNCVRKSVRDEASKQHYFDTFEHPCRGLPLEMDIRFFLATLLFIILSVA